MFDYSFKRSEKVKVLAVDIVISENKVTINPSLLFQSVLVVSKSTPVEISDIMKY